MPDTFNIPENVLRAAVDVVASLDEKGDDYIAQVLETETWEEHVAECVVQACLKEWGATEERWNPGKVERRRLVFPWEPVEGDE